MLEYKEIINPKKGLINLLCESGVSKLVSNLENFWYLFAKKDYGWNPLAPKVFGGFKNAFGYLGNAIIRRNVNNVAPENPEKRRELGTDLAKNKYPKTDPAKLQLDETEKNIFLDDLYQVNNEQTQNKPVPENIKNYLKNQITKYQNIIKDNLKQIYIIADQAEAKIGDFIPVKNEVNILLSMNN